MIATQKQQLIHLMVWQHDVAVRCRKERRSAVRDLIERDIETLGKSGLQLKRESSEDIQVFVKQELIGMITQGVLETALEELAFGSLDRYEAPTEGMEN